MKISTKSNPDIVISSVDAYLVKEDKKNLDL